MKKQYSNVIDLTGQKFNRLTAIEKIPTPGQRGASWLCKCDCGKEAIAYGGHLRSGKRRSCGCKPLKDTWANVVNNLFISYKHKSTHRKIPFNLTKQDFSVILRQHCFFCGVQPSQVYKLTDTISTSNRFELYNGIDRLDSTQGYTKENCVPCCKHCNFAKSNMSADDFYAHIERIYHYQKAKNGMGT